MKKYIDEYGNVHYIKDELGRGGQGVVYITKDGDVVIKEALKNNEIIKDELEVKRFHKKVKNIKFKPIPFDIEIARPLALLKNRAGYVMKMLNNMKPISELFPQEVNPEKIDKNILEFLREIQDERTKLFFNYYFKTGGVRRRLEVLLKIATILYKLHLRGLVYFDISYNNIFFNDENVYFIDIDNLNYNSSIKLSQSVMTEKFEVPEVANKKEANSFYSDIYTFGILAYYMLTLQHPFEGNYEKNNGNNWDDENIDKKNIWNLPWIEDSKDDSNYTNQGLRGKLTITKELDKLFHSLFEEGKKDKYKRPALNLWIKALTKSLYQTLKCPNCNSTYYDKYFDKCPYCESEKPSRIIVNSYLYRNEKKLEKGSFDFVREIYEEIELPQFLFKEFGLSSFVKIKVSKTKVEFHFYNTGKEEIFFNNRKIFRPRQKIGINKLGKGIEIIIKSNTISKYLNIRLIK
jgi:serine/threonine protein kinase